MVVRGIVPSTNQFSTAESGFHLNY